MSHLPALTPLPILVVTRPLAQAIHSVARLQAAGYAAWALPTLEITGLADEPAQQQLAQALAALPTYDLVIWVSPNAILMSVTAAPTLLTTWPATTTIAVLGPGSLQTLQTEGLAPTVSVFSPQGATSNAPAETARYDSETLWQVLNEHYLPRTVSGKWAAQRVLILRGQGGREWLARQLQTAGAVVDVVACYARRCPPLTAPQQTTLRGWQAVQQPLAWVLSSSEGASNLISMLEMGGISLSWARRQPVWVPHPRIAERAKTLGFLDIHLCGTGDSGLIDSLAQARRDSA
ncbi:uroporphyrinogen-III synthase [Parvibium lacunae]|uniref:Uroporphyrinogen-III synthase n=1 Tax=Parvibium lacunae TaxID=1888893 RepID=A0A368L4L0_9BURK|nr:uroporphyrinogen-III synthase [Parvibium lacunae]RCS58362.1 hypothetical protein DU000_05960 [Parvibium lacunae]